MLFSFLGENTTAPVPRILLDAYQVANNFIKKNTNNKICLVFPSKEFTTQWLSLLFTMDSIYEDYNEHKNEIFQSYKKYNYGQLLILNNIAIVKWIGFDDEYIKFSTKPNKKQYEEPIRFAKHRDIIKLQPAPYNKTTLSTYKTVMKHFQKTELPPIDKLLKIESSGNKQFIHNTVCIVNKFKDYAMGFDNVQLNGYPLKEYLLEEKIQDDGNINNSSPLLISNNFDKLIFYMENSATISRIIIDGFNHIHESATNFSDLEKFNIPTILLTDLSEIQNFEIIKNYGFEFFCFTKKNIIFGSSSANSPFSIFEKKLNNYLSFNIRKELCNDEHIEAIVDKLQLIGNDESNKDLMDIKIPLIQLTNVISRICYEPDEDTIDKFNKKLHSIEIHYLKNKLWLGESGKIIGEILPEIKFVIDLLSISPSKKCLRLKELLKKEKFNSIICSTEDEVQAMRKYLKSLPNQQITKVVSKSELHNELSLIKFGKTILTGWPKSNYFNKIHFSYLFSDLTILYYNFENIYHNSLQARNLKLSSNIDNTLNENGTSLDDDQIHNIGYSNLFKVDETFKSSPQSCFDIVDFELKIENAQYSKYKADENIFENIKAKRVLFENETFLFASETHRFLLINDLFLDGDHTSEIQKKSVNELKVRDIIAFINTQRNILVELVNKNTRSDDYNSVNRWITLWKELLWQKYAEYGYNFQRLVRALRRYGCNRRDATIRSWLNDEDKIGPEDDSDLKAIARMTESEELLNNIDKMRKAIRRMTGWRMKAADFVRQRIKMKILEMHNQLDINSKLEIEGLGQIQILKIVNVAEDWFTIDKKYANRLLSSEIQ